MKLMLFILHGIAKSMGNVPLLFQATCMSVYAACAEVHFILISLA